MTTGNFNKIPVRNEKWYYVPQFRLSSHLVIPDPDRESSLFFSPLMSFRRSEVTEKSFLTSPFDKGGQGDLREISNGRLGVFLYT
jgi:hypothetical protein